MVSFLLIVVSILNIYNIVYFSRNLKTNSFASKVPKDVITPNAEYSFDNLFVDSGLQDDDSYDNNDNNDIPTLFKITGDNTIIICESQEVQFDSRVIFVHVSENSNFLLVVCQELVELYGRPSSSSNFTSIHSFTNRTDPFCVGFYKQGLVINGRYHDFGDYTFQSDGVEMVSPGVRFTSTSEMLVTEEGLVLFSNDKRTNVIKNNINYKVVPLISFDKKLFAIGELLFQVEEAGKVSFVQKLPFPPVAIHSDRLTLGNRKKFVRVL